MAGATDYLPLLRTESPNDAAELAKLVRDAHASKTPIYPLGGGTSLQYGVPTKVSGSGISLSKLNRVIDYPARDMTITVEAGATMQQLADVLAAERQTLPLDVPQADRATVGGVVATNWNGPRRFGLGTVRDYVIGISAVDGTGTPFKGGGRVVKNVAGYDFCKLLTGSLGVLGVITQLTFKVRPLPEKTTLLAARLPHADAAERLLAAIGNSQTYPTAIELLAGPSWEQCSALGDAAPRSGEFTLLASLEGSESEVDWMRRRLESEWRELGANDVMEIRESSTAWLHLIEWSAVADSPLVVKVTVPPGKTLGIMQLLRELDPQCSIQSHAGNGIVLAKFSEFPPTGLSRMLIGRLQPAAMNVGGHVIVVANPSGAEATRQSVWGGNEGAWELMRAVKRNFDPHDILNPGRFVL